MDNIKCIKQKKKGNNKKKQIFKKVEVQKENERRNKQKR